MKIATLFAALTLALATGTAAAQTATPAAAGPEAIATQLKQAGYAEVRDIEFDDGLWEAEVRGADGRWHDVAVDAATGEVLDDRSTRPLITAAELVAKLEAAGYTEIRDMDLDDAIWEVDALSKSGQRVELRVNAHSGKVLSEGQDD